MKKVVSFDIFDTCLVRTTGAPDGVFELLARYFVQSGSSTDIVDFIKIRKDGEKRARETSKYEEINIEDIYAQCDFSFATDASKQSILLKELEIEESVLLPVYNIKEKIDKFRDRGYDICFISDIYLPESFIRNILLKYELMKLEDRLYLSSKFKYTKSSGNLYKIFKRDHPYANILNWRHHGDNVYSDFFKSIQKGAFPILISHDYTSFESATLTPFDPVIFSEIKRYSSISRGLRLSNKFDYSYVFAVDVIAPMYVSFTLHILNLAKNRNISDLYFFARDGYLFYLIAQKFQEEYKEIRFHYIYVSRRAIYFPTLDDVDLENLKILFPVNTTIEHISNYLFLDDADFNPDILNSLRAEKSRDRILEIICRDNVLFSKIKKRHIEQKKLFLGYLQQEGLTTAETPAIVDLRGTRKSHEQLNDFLVGNGLERIYGFYYEVVDDRAYPKGCDSYYACIFREQYKNTSLFEPLENFTAIFEQYFSITPQQRTSHYRLIDTNIEPVFENDPVNLNIDELFKINLKACIDYCLNAKPLISAYTAGFVTRMMLSKFLALLGSFNKDVLRLLDGFEMSENEFDKRIYLKKLSLADLMNHKHIMWFKGSVIHTFGRLPFFFLTVKSWIKQRIFK